jgi:fatty acid synthase
MFNSRVSLFVGSHGLPAKSGTLMDISKFDAAFFGVPPKLVDNMDPQLRIMLELTHEALVDSGIIL